MFSVTPRFNKLFKSSYPLSLNSKQPNSELPYFESYIRNYKVLFAICAICLDTFYRCCFKQLCYQFVFEWNVNKHRSFTPSHPIYRCYTVRMSLTIQQIIVDAKRLTGRLKETDMVTDRLLTQTHAISKKIDAMKQVIMHSAYLVCEKVQCCRA